MQHKILKPIQEKNQHYENSFHPYLQVCMKVVHRAKHKKGVLLIKKSLLKIRHEQISIHNKIEKVAFLSEA